MKSIADQNTGGMGGPGSVLSRQRRDHIELHRLLQQLAELPPRQQAPVLIEIYRLVFRHAFAEESVLWPVLRRVLPDGHELTLGVEREHQEINELVNRLESVDPHAPERAEVLNRVIALLLQDVRDEEDVLLPRLQAAVSVRQLRRIGLAWETVRRIAPTRPHPIVARRPPGNVLSALPLTLLDRARDHLDRLCGTGTEEGIRTGRSPSAMPSPRLRARSSRCQACASAKTRPPESRSGRGSAGARRRWQCSLSQAVP